MVAVSAGMPVWAVMAAHTRRSCSSPSQAPEVPFQQMACTLASASSSAAASIGAISNCAFDPSPRSIATTRIRAKCAVT